MSNIMKSPAVLDPLGLFDAYKNPSDEELYAKFEKYRKDTPYMPTEGDERERRAKQAKRKQMASRRGRSSTVNTSLLG